MNKVTKVLTFLMICALLLVPATNVMAGDINSNERELINIGNGVFVYNGVEYIATDEAKSAVYNYLMQDDVDLNASQAAEAQEIFWGNLASGIADGYLVRLYPAEPESGNGTGGSTSTGDGTDSSGDATTETVVSYTYTDITATMYAKQAVNVRTQPSTNGQRIGSLTANQEVAVTGQCVETGWYRIEYNGVTAYVSDNYLSNSKMEEETETTEVTEVEDETQISTELVTEVETQQEPTEVPETEVASENVSATEKAEVTLKNKDFSKGLDVTTVAIVIGAVVLAVAVVVVISHNSSNRRYRK